MRLQAQRCDTAIEGRAGHERERNEASCRAAAALGELRPERLRQALHAARRTIDQARQHAAQVEERLGLRPFTLEEIAAEGAPPQLQIAGPDELFPRGDHLGALLCAADLLGAEVQVQRHTGTQRAHRAQQPLEALAGGDALGDQLHQLRIIGLRAQRIAHRPRVRLAEDHHQLAGAQRLGGVDPHRVALPAVLVARGAGVLADVVELLLHHRVERGEDRGEARGRLLQPPQHEGRRLDGGQAVRLGFLANAVVPGLIGEELEPRQLREQRALLHHLLRVRPGAVDHHQRPRRRLERVRRRSPTQLGKSTATPGSAQSASSAGLPTADSPTCSSELGSERCAMRQVLIGTFASRGC